MPSLPSGRTLLDRIVPGLISTAEIVVGPEHTAPFVGSGRIAVLATPVMINLIEAAALAAVGSGMWTDYSTVAELHQIEDRCLPNPENVSVYQRLLPVYKQAAQHQRKISELLEALLIA